MKIEGTSGQDVVLTPANNKNRKWLVGGAVALSLVLGIWFLLPGVQNWSDTDIAVSSQRINFAEVAYRNFVRDITVQGRVTAAVKPKLYASAQGTITYLVDAGERVTKGQLIAEVESPELTNKLQQEQATLEQMKVEKAKLEIHSKKQALERQKQIDLAEVVLKSAKREKRRADEAFSRQALSKIDYERANDELESAILVHRHSAQDAALNKEEADLEVQTNTLQIDRQRLLVHDLKRQVDMLKILSPVKGMVANLELEQKNQVTKNQSLLTIVDLSEFEVEVDIPESYADDLAIGMEVEISFDNSKFSAELVAIAPEIKDNQVVGRVRFVDQAPENLRQSQRLTTRILLERRDNVLTVQRGPFLESGNGRVAYIVQDGVAERRTIEIGARSLDLVEILNGLTRGEQIVVSGTDQFRGAQRVLITQ